MNQDSFKFQIQDEVYSLASFLPSQLPINHFVHHNTLHTFQEEGYHFHDGIRAAAQIYGTWEYLPLKEYQTLYEKGEIFPWSLNYVTSQEKDFQVTELFHQNWGDENPKRESVFQEGFFSNFSKKYGFSVEEKVNPLVVKFISNYIDQGIASLSFSNSESFWQSLQKLWRTSPYFGVPKHSREWINKSQPLEILETILEPIKNEPNKRKFFLMEVLLKLPGWAGMVYQIEKNPELLFHPRKISLLEYLAFYLALCSGFLAERKLSWLDFFRDYQPTFPEVFYHKSPKESRVEKVCRIWHEAYELSSYVRVLVAMHAHLAQKKKRVNGSTEKTMQIILCVDDRNCSLRRYLEELDESVETFGVAGFFGLDILYLGPHDKKPYKQCPLPRPAKYLVRGITKNPKKKNGHYREIEFWHRQANNLYSGYVLSHVMSFFALFQLFRSLFSSKKNLGTASSLLHFERPVEISYQYSQDSIIPEIQTGFKIEEMAQVVESVLKQIGLVDGLAPIVLVLGHGSTSTNNPYYAAYDCGACSGHPGAVNGRTFALMANQEEVRKILRKRGINIPSQTVFIGGLQDTTRDEIHLFDIDKLPPQVKEKIPKILDYLNHASRLNAKERVRRFPLVKSFKSYESALKEVRLRSTLLYEPRPEYNHATNFVAVVARRNLSKGLFLDRRAFLNSYEPNLDPKGKILESTLSALIPVVGGINLEYFFSRIDNEKYGSGSKLPHNVISLVGVSNGAEGDLRTGLPAQMVEIHDPIRLLLIIEHKVSVLKNILKRNHHIQQWISGEWVRCAVLDPWEEKFYFFEKGKFVPLKLPQMEIPVISHSEKLSSIRGKNIPPTIIGKERI